MQETHYQAADAGLSLPESGCRRLSIRQRMQETLYQTAGAEVSLSDRGCRRLLHLLSDRVSPAFAV